MNFFFKHRMVIIVVLMVVFILALSLTFYYYAPLYTKVNSDWKKINFDVKLVRVNTNIDIFKENTPIGTVKGNIFRFLTDPLTYYDNNGEKIAYADDSYHLISQDSHSIIIDGLVNAEMVGKIKFLGEAYDIYNTKGKKMAYAEFDFFNITGRLLDVNGQEVVIYRANPFLRDFTLYIAPNCLIDEKTLIMIFSSYYSDYTVDDRNSSKSIR